MKDNEFVYLKIKDKGSDALEEKKFHFVIVCNGHHTKPNIPKIEGINMFQGNILHSHHYRSPDSFSGKNVLIIGAGPSGVDIAGDVATVSKKVLISHNNSPITAKMKSNIQDIGKLEKFIGPFKIRTKNDDEHNAIDALIYCTGYSYNFNFMDGELQLENQNDFLYPLYKHLVDARNPNIFYMGIPKKIAPFPLFHSQALYIHALLLGELALPTYNEMIHEIKDEYYQKIKSAGKLDKYFHIFNDQQWKYNDSLIEEAKASKHIPNSVKNLYAHVSNSRKIDLENYKYKNYKLIDEEHFEQYDF